jgi:hypothetical protein
MTASSMTSWNSAAAPVHRLVYCSRIHLLAGEQAADVVIDILKVASLRNRQAKITGALLVCGGWFLQVLEGPLAAINETYRRIYNDRRNHTLRVIAGPSVAKRLFPEWSMCGRELSATDKSIVDVLEGRRHFDASLLTEQSALRVFGVIRDLQTRERQSASP